MKVIKILRSGNPLLFQNSKHLLFLFFLLLAYQAAFAQNWNQIIKATAGDRMTKTSSARNSSDYFGFRVAIDGNYAIVGAHGEDNDTSESNFLTSSGSAFILYNNSGTWVQIKKLTAANRSANDEFGISVAISGDYAIVGARFESEDASEASTITMSGSAYIFKRNQGGTNQWGQIKKICASTRGAGDQFGWSVGISGDYAIVGALAECEDASEANTLSASGSAYIFKQNQGGSDNWGQVKKICASARLSDDQFGYSVAISGDYAIVGANQEDQNATESSTLSNSGSAYIFKQNQGGSDNWGQVKKICASARLSDDQFGWSVGISGNYAIVGAPYEDQDVSEANTSTNSGSAYIFKQSQGGTDNWGQIKKICASTRAANDYFGISVAISGDYAIVGATSEDEDASEANNKSASGSAYIFKQSQGGTDQWGQIKKICASSRLSNVMFGSSVAISGDHAIVGTEHESRDESDLNPVAGAGSTYIFKQSQGGSDQWGLLQKMVKRGIWPDDNYGYSMAISGDYAIVGAINDDKNASGSDLYYNTGSAYILKNINGSWSQIKKICAPAREELDKFGYSVAISGDYAIVGAYLEDQDASETNMLSGAGSAYIFKRNQGGSDNWGQIKKICASARLSDDQFGFSVAISGNYAIVGANQEDQNATESSTIANSGSAYIFKQSQGGTDNWGQIKKICASTRAADDNFGISVAISGDYAIVGAQTEDEDGSEASNLTNSGSAYIFKRSQGGTDQWGQIKKICASTRGTSDLFGCSVAISGDYAIVGAYYEDEDASEANTLNASGSAYIFKQNQGGADQWGQVKKICASTREADDNFGVSVAISGDYAAIGAHLEDQDASEGNTLNGSGSAYIFKQSQGGTDQWGQVKKICASTRAADDNFGVSVAISGDYAAIGAYLEDQDASEGNTLSNAGAAYFFYNGCHPTSAIPTTANTTFTSSYKTTDALGWSHYCTSDDKLVLSLKIGSTGAVVADNEVQLRTGSNATYSSSSSGGMITNSNGYTIIDRRWDVSPNTQPSSGNVGIKYYFTNAEYNAEVTALAALSSPTTITHANQLNMYKATSGSAFADPHTVNGIVLVHGSTPSTSIWKWAQQGTSNHSAEFEVASFSGGGGGGGGGNAPLPVELISFTGKLISAPLGKDAHLFWTTATEINNAYFDIERSVDGIRFIKIGQVNGQGNSTQLLNYTFIDPKVSELGVQELYYRLKQVDFNSTYDFTKPIVLYLDSKRQKPSVSPNPFNNELNISVSTNAHVLITNLLGAIVLDKTLKNENGFETINTAELLPGVYMLKITEGHLTHHYKIIKHQTH